MIFFVFVVLVRVILMELMHRKRVFPGGSSIDAWAEDVSPPMGLISKPESAKQKEPIHHEEIDLDMKGGYNDVICLDEDTESTGKGKDDFLQLSLGCGGSANSVGPSEAQSSKKHCPSESDEMPTDLLYEDHLAMYMDWNDLVHNDYANLQSHFDHMDTTPGVEVPLPWMPGFAKATKSTSFTSKASSTPFGGETPEVLKDQSTSWYDLNNAFKPTPFELSLSSGGPAFGKSKFPGKGNSKGITIKEQNDSTNGSRGAEKSVPGAIPFPTVPFGPPPMPGWMNLPHNMTTAQASSGFMLAPGAMNPPPMNQFPYVLPPNAMNYSPQEQLSSGSVLAPDTMHYFHPEMVPGLWAPGPHNSATPLMPVLHNSTNLLMPGPYNSANLLMPGLHNSMNLFMPAPHNSENLLMYVPHNSANLSLQCESAPSKEQLQNLDESLKNFRLFKKFDTVEDHSDHYFAAFASHDNQASKGCTKRIQEEWKILEKDLPDTIFVRVYETRMDLLRAVIIGADGTPYHDGLFFFDVLFPSNYPHDPPQVHYHSFGLRINPNLYECGKVCLSLLNTWEGGTKEKWIPSESTMLQVLVSIQGLILNAKPYFNEPGYEMMSGSLVGEQGSLQYNEGTCISNLKSMVYCIRRPPKHFEDFVVGHYFHRCQDILTACKAYMEGACVGSLVKGCVVEDGGYAGSSEIFRATLAEFMGILVAAFTQIGVKDCQKFLPSADKASTTGEISVKMDAAGHI